MLTLYHVSGTRSVRSVWLCYELALEFELVSIDFSREYRDSDEWRSISPAGKVPALRDGELTMFESGAMQSYLLERYGEGRLQPRPVSSVVLVCRGDFNSTDRSAPNSALGWR